MPRVLDNIALTLLSALREMLEVSHRADFCVGYLHLRGWRKVADLVERFEGGSGNQARVLVGMTTTPEYDLETDLSLLPSPPVDHGLARRRETQIVEAFRRQLTLGLPDTHTEAGLRHLARQLRAGKVSDKLFLRHRLHAKQHSRFIVRNQRLTGEVRLQSFQPALSKPITDDIDRLLAGHYGFTDDELDYILNYDIKYRIGDDGDVD